MVVYKIGGSSLDSLYKLKCILKLLNNEDKKLIVVSAIGRYPNAYATDTLIASASNVSEEEKNLLVSTGEIISSIYFSNFLNKNKIKSIALSPYIFDINNINVDYINNLFEQYNTIIVPGFIYTINNIIYTLPRGGSTITASLLAKQFSKELIIITDICGIYNKDPKEKDAIYYPSLTYKEFLNLDKAEKFFPKESIKILNNNKIKTKFIKFDDCSKCTTLYPEKAFL